MRRVYVGRMLEEARYLRSAASALERGAFLSGLIIACVVGSPRRGDTLEAP